MDKGECISCKIKFCKICGSVENAKEIEENMKKQLRERKKFWTELLTTVGVTLAMLVVGYLYYYVQATNDWRTIIKFIGVLGLINVIIIEKDKKK